jgi:hypothetical protein
MLPFHEFKGDDQDIFVKANSRDKVAMGILFAEHTAAQAECFAIGQKIADACNCTLIKGPMKSAVRAEQKVSAAADKEGYAGDWSQLKDLLRMTILATKSYYLQLVKDQVLALGSRPPWYIITNKEKEADTDPCGYSGLHFVLQKNRAGSVGAEKLGQRRSAPPPDVKGISNAQWAKTVRMEIQANLPAIIYGKESKGSFVGALGDELFAKMKGMTKIVGGLGHVLYEISKGPFSFQTQETAKSLSKKYYQYLRAPQSVPHKEFTDLCNQLTDIVADNREFFNKKLKPPVDSISLIQKTPIPNNLPKQ